MRTGWLTGILFAAAVLVALVVPPVREAWVAPLRATPRPGYTPHPFPSVAELEEIAKRYPADADMWLGYAETAEYVARTQIMLGASTSLQQISAADAYEKALALAPDSAPIRFRYALHCLGQAGEMGRGEERRAGTQARSRTAAESANLDAARALFEQCRELAPGNAACDYLLAWTYLAEHQDADALAVLRAASRKNGWDSYRRDAAAAVLRVFDETDVPFPIRTTSALSAHSGNEHAPSAALGSMGRLVTALGHQFRSQGDYSRAILCYEAVIRLGYLMRVHADSIIGGIVGAGVSHMPASSFLTEEERRRISQSAKNGDARLQMLRPHAERLAAYIRSHGRADLADFYLRDIDEAVMWQREAHGAIGNSVPRVVQCLYGGGVLNAAAVWMATVALMVLLGVVAIISPTDPYTRGHPHRPTWGYAEWLLLLAICLIPGQAVAGLATLRVARMSSDPSSGLVPWLLVATAVGVAAWLIGVRLLVLRKRDGQPAEQRLAPKAAYLAGLRTLIGPTLAALVLLGVFGLWAPNRNFQKFDQMQRAVMLDEVEYWGIGKGQR